MKFDLGGMTSNMRLNLTRSSETVAEPYHAKPYFHAVLSYKCSLRSVLKPTLCLEFALKTVLACTPKSALREIRIPRMHTSIDSAAVMPDFNGIVYRPSTFATPQQSFATAEAR
jgi:hypothetical protein